MTRNTRPVPLWGIPTTTWRLRTVLSDITHRPSFLTPRKELA